ncbi:MAG: ABC transporter permease [Spirillospora sp.]
MTAVRWLIRRPGALYGTVVLGVLVVCALLPTSLLPHDPARGNSANRLQAPGSGGFPLGTDALGRDILSVLVAGARFTLLIVLCSAAIALLVGVPLGLLAGYYGRWLDATIMRVTDVQLAFPVLVLLIAVVAAFGPSVTNLILILGFTGWAPYARLVRGEVLRLREKEFVEAAVAIGLRDVRVLFRHLLPNTATTIVVFLTFEFARLVLTESALSFLGLGVQPPTPSWGALTSEGRQYIDQAWWVAALPGLAIVLTVLAFNLLGDAIRDVVDSGSEG